MTHRINYFQRILKPPPIQGVFYFRYIYIGMRLIESIKQIISEASKKQILMDKIGFNEESADILDQLCGPLSVWVGNKMIQYQKESNPDEKDLMRHINLHRIVRNYRNYIQSIMDWVRVGLNGNVKQYQDLSFLELIYQENGTIV